MNSPLSPETAAVPIQGGGFFFQHLAEGDSLDHEAIIGAGASTIAS